MPMAARRIVVMALAAGCVGAAFALAGDPPARPSDVAPPETFGADALDHWAYQPVKRSLPPPVKESDWVRNPIDRFILAGLEEMGFRHAPEADRPALIRRVTYDLTGLPPTPAEVDAFSHDPRPDAYERLVDRLLSSPHHGERWGQHWLDLAHYADSNGFELDAERPDAWRYRDWVVRALNADLPYDRFLTLQLAGDEVAPGDHDALIATGFCRCGPREVVGGNVIPEVKRQSELSEITGTVGSVFLGLTVGCARCHDHKFDAIPTTDYYRLQSFFAASQLEDVPIASEAERAAFAAAQKAVNAKIAPLRKELAQLEAPIARRSRRGSWAMLSAEERAVMSTPAAKRTTTPEAAGPGAGDVAASHLGGRRRGRGRRPGRASPARRAQAGDRRDRADPAASAGARHGAGRSQVEGDRHVRPAARRLQEPRPAGRAPAAGRDPGFAERRAFTDSSIVPTGDKTGRRQAPGAMARPARPIR